MKGQIEDLGKASVTVEDYIPGKPYSELTIVSDPCLGISAISRRPVPKEVPITDKRYWMVLTKLEVTIMLNYRKMLDEVAEMKQLMESFLKTSGGTALTNQFGDSEVIGITQKTLTEFANNIISRIDDITGETTQDITMTVTPDFFISEDKATVEIKATTLNGIGKFEHIEFWANGKKIDNAEANNIDYFEFSFDITDTTIVQCFAKILGITYTKQRIITHYNSYWLGTGVTYSDIMINDNLRSIEHHMRAAYDLNVEQGDHIIIVLGKSLEQGFIRADIDGLEIKFDKQYITIDNNAYVVFTSQSTYNAGVINVDING